MTAYNPRYVAYAAAHGETPEGMLARDQARWPGGCMVGFIGWMSERWAEFRRLRPAYFESGGASAEGHRQFDAWLCDTVVGRDRPALAQVPATAGLPLFDGHVQQREEG